MKIAAYCRVSTKHEEQIESLENQKKFFEEFSKKNNHTIYKIYSDEGISGKEMTKRKAFQSMLCDAKLGCFEMLAVKDISRFARNTVDFLTAIRELKKYGVEVQFVSINQTVLGNSEFLLTLFSAMAQEESANLSARIKFGKKMSAQNGKVPNFIYGYNRIDRFTLEINKEQAEIVRKIYDMYIHDGIGSRKIADKLNEAQIQSYRNRLWSAKTIRRILTNPIYKGELISKKTEMIDFITGTRIKLEIKPEYQFERKEWGIISEEEFAKAQKILFQKTEKCLNKRSAGRMTSQYPFSGLIQCKSCGHFFSRRTVKRNYGYYVRWICTGRNCYSSDFCGNALKIREDELLEMLIEYFIGIIGNENDFLIKCNKEIEKENSNCKKDLSNKKYHDEILQLNAKKQKYKNMYISEIISLEELKKKTEAIDKSINELKAIIFDKSEEKTLNRDNDLHEKIRRMLTCQNFSNIALKEIIECIEADEYGNIDVILKEFNS